jgi:hypothetical protein
MIRVISADLDGGDLRREKAKTPAYTRCEVGTNKEASRPLKGEADQYFTIAADRWQQIFGGQNGNSR